MKRAKAEWEQLHARHVGGAKPMYKVLVPDSIPTEVRLTWQARQIALAPGTTNPLLPGRLLNRNFIKSNVVYNGAVTATAVTTSGTAAVTGVASALSVFDPIAALLTTGVVFGVGAIGSARAGYRYAKDPRRLSRKQRELAAQARWVTPQSFGYYRVKHGIVDSREQRLFHLLVTMSREIVATRAWTSNVLEAHVSRLDLDHAVAGIGARLMDLYQLGREVDEIRGPATMRQAAALTERLDAAFESMARRVVSLDAYLQRLLALDEKLLMLEQIEQSRQLGDRVLDVISRTADDDAADWHIRELNLEAESHTEVIEKLLDELEDTVDEFEAVPGGGGDEFAAELGRASAAFEDLATTREFDRPTGQYGPDDR